jgi:hypothetical protein
VVLLIVLIRILNSIKDWRKTTIAASDKLITNDGPSLLMQIESLTLPLEEHPTEEEKLSDWTRFSSAASVILRRAFEARTKLPVVERTTDEINAMFADSGVSSQSADAGELIKLLRSLDDITFAGRISSVSDAASLLARVKVTIRNLTEGQVQRSDLSVSSIDGVKIFE